MDDNKEKLLDIAKSIMNLSRNTLLVNLRFLDLALGQFRLIPAACGGLMTDGEHIVYDPRFVLKRYAKAQEVPVRDYLHMVMHCVFKHMYMEPSLDREYWDVACDIAVENTITELGLRCVSTGAEGKQAEYINAIKGELKLVTAEKIYAFLRDGWADRERLKSIAERMQVDMETFGKQRGLESGALTQNLKEVTREKYDYAAFLKKFAVMGEVMRINDEEFDYVYYTYGLKLYDKMPLIEPLEYKDVKRIREFVIAIDTSGSTSGELVQKFLQKTYNILMESESFFSKVNVHIIQCDANIQEDAKLTNREEFDRYIKTMQIRGLGGTDFRPVFQYVNKLIAEKEFINLKGLIYFTDGFGAFPAQKPGYETAFVFIDNEINNYEVPPWAIKLVLRKNEI